MAMRIVADTARMLGAARLVPIASAHIDGCLYHGDSGTHFAEKLVAGGGKVAVPTTLNVGALDLLHAGRVKLPPATRGDGAAHDGRLSRARLRADLDLRALPGGASAGGRPARGVGRKQRRRLLQFRAGRAHRALRRLPRHLRRARRPRAGDRAASRRQSPRRRFWSIAADSTDAWSTTTRSGRCWARGWARPPAGRIVAFTGLPEADRRGSAEGDGRGGGLDRFGRAVPYRGRDARGPFELAAARDHLTLDGAMLHARARSRCRRRRAKAGDRVDAVAVGSPHFSVGEFTRLLRRLERPQARDPDLCLHRPAHARPSSRKAKARHRRAHDRRRHLHRGDADPAGEHRACCSPTPASSRTTRGPTPAPRCCTARSPTAPRRRWPAAWCATRACGDEEAVARHGRGPRAASCRRCRCGAASIRSAASSPIRRCRIAARASRAAC